MRVCQQEGGFSLVDVLVAVALVGIVTAMAIPMTDSASRGFRLKGDAQAVANTVALAKMRAASRFSRTRIRADLAARTYQLEIWDKTANVWTLEGAVVTLSNGVTFGFAGLATPPPNTQAVIGQSPACTVPDGGGGQLAVAGTACIAFNSRGIPIDPGGAPVGGNALYITDGSAVYATTITATPLVRQWWSNAAAVAWVRQ